MAGAELHFLEQGSGPPLAILHGLFGSARNWASIARELAGAWHVYALDLRNHGDSPRLPEHTLDDLAGDLLSFLKKVGTPTVVMGHSMGGLAAMRAAMLEADLITALVIVDIAPRSYAPRHHREFAALRLDLKECRSRQEVDSRMAEQISDPVVRQFLQMNLARNEADQFYWKIPIDTLEKASFIERFPEEGRYEGPALFIAGGKSDYVLPEDAALIRARFPGSRLETISQAGHWPHFSHQVEFLRLVTGFLADLP